MVLDHVAESARFLVVGAASFDADGFGSGDLDVIDVATIPKRLENTVAEAERENVLNGLFPEIVIDAVDLRFVEDFVDFLVQLAGAGEVMTEGLFDNDAPPAITPVKTMGAELLDGFGIVTGLGRKIKENVSSGSVRLFYFIELIAEIIVGSGIVQISWNIEQRLGKGVPDIFVERSIFEEAWKRIPSYARGIHRATSAFASCR